MSDLAKKILQFKITLRGIRPPIWRRIQVPGYFTFFDLHIAIQDAMDWEDAHLYSFIVTDPATGEKINIQSPSDDQTIWDEDDFGDDMQEISEYFTKKSDKGMYLYDFGDNWEHDLKLEKILPRDPEKEYPACLAGKRACPPEDCGGIPGYTDMLEIISDPENEEYEETREWLDESFDPEYFNKEEIFFRDALDMGEEFFGSLPGSDAAADDYFDDSFTDEDGSDEDGYDEDMSELISLLKVMEPEYNKHIWEKAKAGKLDQLPAEERQIGEIMLDHQDEFFNQLEISDVLHDHEYDPDTESNPFLHIQVHCVVENQLAGREPIEVFQFYNAMKKKKVGHHDTVHLIGAMLMPLMFKALADKEPFENELYKSLLKKYKARKPEKIWDLLEKEDLL